MKSLIMLAFGVALASSAAAGPRDPHQRSGSVPSISPDEKAIYEVLLETWLGGAKRSQLVNVNLSPRLSKSDPEFGECTKGLSFPPPPSDEHPQKNLSGVHFSQEGIVLVEGSQWTAHDPGSAIRDGEAVGSAVERGISHSLLTFSQIAFSRDGRDALVKFGVVCGALCGTGSTIHLHKRVGRWVEVGRCGGWIS